MGSSPTSSISCDTAHGQQDNKHLADNFENMNVHLSDKICRQIYKHVSKQKHCAFIEKLPIGTTFFF